MTAKYGDRGKAGERQWEGSPGQKNCDPWAGRSRKGVEPVFRLHSPIQVAAGQLDLCPLNTRCRSEKPHQPSWSLPWIKVSCSTVLTCIRMQRMPAGLPVAVLPKIHYKRQQPTFVKFPSVPLEVSISTNSCKTPKFSLGSCLPFFICFEQNYR